MTVSNTYGAVMFLLAVVALPVITLAMIGLFDALDRGRVDLRAAMVRLLVVLGVLR